MKEGDGKFFYLDARKKYEGVWKEGQAIKGALSPMEPGDLEGKDVKPPSKPPRELPQVKTFCIYLTRSFIYLIPTKFLENKLYFRCTLQAFNLLPLPFLFLFL